MLSFCRTNICIWRFKQLKKEYLKYCNFRGNGQRHPQPSESRRHCPCWPPPESTQCAADKTHWTLLGSLEGQSVPRKLVSSQQRAEFAMFCQSTKMNSRAPLSKWWKDYPKNSRKLSLRGLPLSYNVNLFHPSQTWSNFCDKMPKFFEKYNVSHYFCISP